MQDILDIADKMTESITDSKIFKDYIDSKNKILEDDELTQKMIEFKQKHIEFQNKRINGDNIDIIEEVTVSRMYFSLCLIPEVKQFLENEESLLALLGEIYKKLGSQCKQILIKF